MQVLAISGSLRSQSHNSRLLRLATARLPEGATFTSFEAIAAITAFDQDVEHLPPEAVVDLKQAIARADAVLIATPEYNSSIPGALKNALDWASRPYDENPLRNKPVAVIGASAGMSGAVEAQADLRKVLARIGARVVEGDLPVARVGTLEQEGELVLPEALVHRLDRLIEALAESVAGQQVASAA
jgi:chromate reductase